MYISKFKVALTVIILSAIICLASAMALLTAYYTIPSHGAIPTIGPSVARESDKSEIRYLFVHSFSFANPDWDLIAQTAKDYGINMLVIEAAPSLMRYVYWQSAYRPSWGYVLADAIAAAHARGMELHISAGVLLSPLDDEYKVVGPDGLLKDWGCPTKQASRTLLRNLMEEVASNYDIDGFIFDYIRYDTHDMCYCDECKAKFIADTGLTDVQWTSDVVEGGRYHNEFMEWRIQPINELVRDMRSWLLAVKPDLKIGAFGWRSPPGWPTYWRYWIGQDWTYWVKEGWLDWVFPMIYVNSGDIIGLTGQFEDILKYQVGGPEGKIPVAPILTNVEKPEFRTPKTPEDFKLEVDKLRELGADGWGVWRYGGPGDNSGAPDIRDYLNVIDLYPVFSIQNINALPTADACTITWTTDLPTTSRVEFSTSPLFTANYKYDSRVDFHYWDIDHVPGTIVEDMTLVTSHSVTLTGLLPGTKYYFRVQSEDQYGTVTSKIYEFTTSVG